jgi:aspartate aminotransferase
MKLANRALKISPSPTLAIEAKAKEMRAKGVKVISFGAGEPDFDTPAHIVEAAVRALRAGKTKYTPVSGVRELKEAICRKLKEEQGLEYKIEQVVVSAGAKQSLYNAVQVLVQEGDEVILPSPYWVSYLEQVKLAGASAKIVDTKEENGFKLLPEELHGAISERTRLLILNSPNNPTGAVYTESELKELAEVLRPYGDLMIISDEIYEKLIYDGLRHVSIASLHPELKERTVVINGVSKAYAMTGWRIGYAAAPLPVALAMSDLQSHSTSNAASVCQEASIEALNGPQESVAQMVLEFARRRDYMLKRLCSIPGVSCMKPGGAFYLFPNVRSYFGKAYKGRPVNCASDLAKILLEEAEVAVVPGIAFGNDNYLRLSYACSMEDIKEGLDRIVDLMALLE